MLSRSIKDYRPLSREEIERELADINSHAAWYSKGMKGHLLLLFPQAAICGYGVPEVFPPGYRRLLALSTDRFMYDCFDPRDFQELGVVIIDKTIRDPRWIDRYYSEFQEASQVLRARCHEIFHGSLPSDVANLKEDFLQFLDLAVVPQAYGYLTDATAHTDDYWVTNYLQQCDPQFSEEAIRTLLAPTYPSFHKEYEKALMGNTPVQTLVRDWFWIKGSYFQLPALTAELVREDQKEIATHYQPFQAPEKSHLIPSQEVADFVHVMEQFIRLQDDRKANVFHTNYVLQKFVSHITTLVPDWTAEELLSLTPLEIIDLLEGNPGELKEILQKRNQKSAWIWGKTGYMLSTDPEITEQFSFLLPPETTTLRGYTGCKGVARGRVKIVLSQEDFASFEDGNILVTTMTRPDFLPIMKKAAAFITNEGGVTCHAAVLARELNIPCIIGTRSATTFLKDGDMVEVNADTAEVVLC